MGDVTIGACFVAADADVAAFVVTAGVVVVEASAPSDPLDAAEI